MSKTYACPTCQSWLLAHELQGVDWRCPTCNRIFVTGSESRQALLQGVTSCATQGEPLPCPACSTPMRAGRLMDAELQYCPACWGSWLPEVPPLHVENSQSFGLGRALLYGLSFPERALRGTIGLTAGAVQGTAAFLVPKCFQSSKTYEIVVRNSLRLLAEDVGGVKPSKRDDALPVENYLARKTVGNFVDLVGIASLHLSPLWLLAIVSDVAYGTKSYVAELADELKQQGLIDEHSTIDRVDDLLDAIRQGSGRAASLFDTPPLNVDELKQSLRDTKASLKNADLSDLLPEAEIARYWTELKQLAAKEQIGLLGLSGAVTLHTLKKVGMVGQGTLAGVRVAGGLLQRHILGHYGEALDEYRRRGLYASLRDDSAPYIEAVWNNFSPQRSSWTEELVSGRAISGLFQKVSGLFKSRPAPEAPASDGG